MKKEYNSPVLHIEVFESESIMALISNAQGTGSNFNATDPGWN